MGKLVKGENLTPDQIKQVKAAFIYRLTVENLDRVMRIYPGGIPNVELTSDSHWIAEHSFNFLKSGKLGRGGAKQVYEAD